MLSGLPGAVQGLGQEHGLTPSMQQHWEEAKLSRAAAQPNAVAQALVLWRSASSPYSLVRFQDLAILEESEVC